MAKTKLLPMRVTGEVLEKARCVSWSVKEFSKKWPQGLMLTHHTARLVEEGALALCRVPERFLTQHGYDCWCNMGPSSQDAPDLWRRQAYDFLICVRNGHLRARIRKLMEAAAAKHKSKRGR